jgi:hypothetical protein
MHAHLTVRTSKIESMQALKLLYQLVVTLLISVFLISCVPQNIPLKRDIKTINKIVAIPYPPDEVAKFGGAAGAAILLGSLPAVLIAVSEGKKMIETYSLPHYGRLVLDNFLTHATDELRYWPEVIVEQNEEKASKLAEGQFLLEIRPKIIRVRYFLLHKGLNSITTALLKDSTGQVIWQSSFEYRSEDYGRNAHIDQWEENEGKLLKEEWAFAAEETATFFSRSITHRQLK